MFFNPRPLSQRSESQRRDQDQSCDCDKANYFFCGFSSLGCISLYLLPISRLLLLPGGSSPTEKARERLLSPDFHRPFVQLAFWRLHFLRYKNLIRNQSSLRTP
uniref:hypothetical protein n=1 Tax=Jatropha curcas TaxID=180498 RepID=UPI0027AAD37C|nr:hypothetical protein QLP06_mgp101 [Jatropha curcas]WFG81138.1 hypothetical protein [Jatropha curcas]